MSLQSRFLKGESSLEACLVQDSAHLTPGSSGDGVALVQKALLIVDGSAVSQAERTARQYGSTTAAAVLAFKTKRGIINRAYQSKPDNIVGKMTIAALDRDVATAEAPNPGFTGFTSAEIVGIGRDISRARTMVAETLRRLRTIGAGTTISPHNQAYFDTKAKVLNVFRVNTFLPGDLPIPAGFLAAIRSVLRGGVIPGEGDPGDALNFVTLLANFIRLQQAMQANFPKTYFPKATFKGQGMGYFAAFVDATAPADSTVRFTPRYFDPQAISADGRAVTLAHERCHTIFRARSHPGTGDSPFCVAPHLGDPNVTSFDQAIANPYCYEWLIDALQSNYNPSNFNGIECGTLS